MINAELETSTIEIVNSIDNVAIDNTNITAGYDNSYNVDIEDLSDLDITVSKKEYTIVGDGIFIPSMYDDAPPWLKELIDTTINVAVTNRDQSLIDRMEAILTAMDYVPKNQYTEQINQIVSEDGIIDSRIATLNSNLTDAINTTNATIAEINLTYASKNEAAAIANNVITASLSADGEIGSALIQLQEAYADLESTTAQSISMLESVMEGEINGNAAAMETIRTYVGIDESGDSTGTGLLADVSILQKQNDGVIETVTGTYDVMLNPQDPNLAELVLTAEPYASWKAQDVSGIDTRLSHIGDVYIKYGITINGAREYVASFKFIRTIVDANDAHKSTDDDGFTWALIVDQAAQDAYNQALNAYDLADNKRRVFVTTPTGPYDVGDLWTRLVGSSNQIWRATVARANGYSESEWVVVSTDDSATVALQTGLSNGTVTVKLTNAFVGTTPFLTYLTSEIDSKVGVYSGETAPIAGQPSGVAANDIYLWFTTASKVLADGTTQVYDITRTYKYSGSVWNEITTDSNITALADLADGKRTVFSGNTVPVGAVARDIWIPSATNGSYLKGEIYQYSGSAWIVATKYSADLEAVRSNLQSQVDGKVETYYQATVPTGMTSVNNGDYWYCTADVSTYKKGKVYKYVHATTSWVETADVSRYAFDTADGKASIFTSTNAPTTGYKVNDMLIVIGSFNNGTTIFSDGVVLSSNANRVSGFTASDWVKKINDTEDLDAFVSTTYTPTVTSLQNQVDGKVESWFQNSANDPKTAWTDAATRSKHDGDLWYQLDTKRSYWYSSSTNAWNLIDDEKAIQALTNAAAAQTAANNAQTSANTANSLLADIASDNKLVPSEKVSVKKEWDIIQSEYTKNLAQANVYSVSTSSYTSAYNSLNGYITPLLSNLTTTSDIVGITFRSMFKAYYDANVDLLNAVANKINAIADGKITSYYIDTFSSLQALSNGWTTAEKASNVGDLATVWNDSTLDNNGLWRWNGTNWISARDKKLVSLASEVTNLNTELNNGTNTWASADSELENSVKTEISSEGARVESKFAYNSIVNINGIYKKSGFGLSTKYTSGSGTEVDPYVSEFWIDASRFKFTNSNQTGQVAPFTIDASGATPQITFNGKVSFSNVNSVPDYALDSKAQDYATTALNSANSYTDTKVSTELITNNDVFAQRLGYANYTDMVTAAINGKTITNGGYINTELIEANAIKAEMIDANAISGKTISGGLITGTTIYGAYIEGAVIKASYIDLTSTATLTNWQQYTPANYPSAYDANFVKNNDGTLLVDSLGYVRLMGNTNIVTGSANQSSIYNSGGSWVAVSLAPYEINIHPYNDYKYNDINRCITSNFIMSIPISQEIIFCHALTWAEFHSTQYSNARFYINEDYYELYAQWTQGSTIQEGSGSAWIKKNNVTIKSTSWGSYGNGNVTYTAYIGDLPITLTSGGTSSNVLVSAKTALLNTSTNVTGYSGVYNSMFRLTYLYSSKRYQIMYNVPPISII